MFMSVWELQNVLDNACFYFKRVYIIKKNTCKCM